MDLAIYANNQIKIPEIVNTIAPEHLEIDFKNYKKIIKKIKNAGSIFIGKFSPEAMGDYIAGPNHVLTNVWICKIFIWFISK